MGSIVGGEGTKVWKKRGGVCLLASEKDGYMFLYIFLNPKFRSVCFLVETNYIS